MNGLERRSRLIAQLLRTQGPGWLAFRARHAFSRRAGLLRRRLPESAWDAHPLARALRDPSLADPESYRSLRRSSPPPFFIAPGSLPDASNFSRWDAGRVGPTARADELSRGTLCYFGHTPGDVGFPPRWHRDPFTGASFPADRHFSRIGDFDRGDIKVIWEPSRFGFAYTLARAYARDRDESYPELFWRLVESWRDENPPQQGPNWKCGQEISLRLMAWCFGLFAFFEAKASTPERVADLAQMIAVSGHRIEATLSYALSQRNNHGISEGVGLWTIGSLFPEFGASSRWEARGRRVLEGLGRDLIYDDGAFSQHSTNYHRMMLHAYLWALRLADLQGRPFSDDLRGRVARAGDFLVQLQDESTGQVPCYGHHDGALLLALNNCDDRDYRPVLQATRYLADRTHLYPEGPWDEDLLWLFGVGSLGAPVSPPTREDLHAEVGGYHTLRSGGGFAFVRCATFRHRPAQADMLHLDLWWRGQNVACDAGTYSYNAPAPWDQALAETAPHNTVGVDGLSQMDRPGKFLWLPWLRGTVRYRGRSAAGTLAYWEGEHDGYRRLKSPVRHRRSVVRLGEEHWLVLDDLRSPDIHRCRLHWLLPDFPHAWDAGETAGEDRPLASLALETPAGPYAVRVGYWPTPARASLVRADPDGPRGWRSPYYLHREPALSLEVALEAACVRFWTILGPPGVTPVPAEGGLIVDAPSWAARLDFGAGPDAPIAARVRLEGTLDDLLEIAR